MFSSNYFKFYVYGHLWECQEKSSIANWCTGPHVFTCFLRNLPWTWKVIFLAKIYRAVKWYVLGKILRITFYTENVTTDFNLLEDTLSISCYDHCCSAPNSESIFGLYLSKMHKNPTLVVVGTEMSLILEFLMQGYI